jgi:hypothetical protein
MFSLPAYPYRKKSSFCYGTSNFPCYLLRTLSIPSTLSFSLYIQLVLLRASDSYKNACARNRTSIAHFIFLTAFVTVREGLGESRCRLQIDFSAFRRTIYRSILLQQFQPHQVWAELVASSFVFHQANTSRNDSCKAFDHHTVSCRKADGL